MFRAIGPSAAEAGARAAETARAIAAEALEQAARQTADALKQDASTAATDPELAAAVAVETARAIAAEALKQGDTLTGTLAARPAAAAGNAKLLYFATDDNGGTLYRSDGSAWAKIAASALQVGGAELANGFAQTTSQLGSVTSTTKGNNAWTGLSITPTVGSTPIVVRARCGFAANNTSGDFAAMGIFDTTAGTCLATDFVECGAGSIGAGPLNPSCRLTAPTAGHTYAVKCWVLVGGTATFQADDGSGSGYGPAYIQAVGV